MQDWQLEQIEQAETIETDAKVAGMIASFLRDQQRIDQAEQMLTGARLRDFQSGVVEADTRWSVRLAGSVAHHAA